MWWNQFLYFHIFLTLLHFNFFLSFYAVDKTPLRKNGCLSNQFLVLTAQAFSFITHFVTYGTPSHAIGHHTHLTEPAWLMGYHATSLVTIIIPHQHLPTEAEDFCRSGKYPKHIPLLTYFAYLPPKGITS